LHRLLATLDLRELHVHLPRVHGVNADVNHFAILVLALELDILLQL
jgi:hypothetical protein